jgi:hypothetical protein
MLTQTTNLFHASLPDVESRIVSEGILLNHQGLINLSGFASHAAGYVNLLGCVRIEGVVLQSRSLMLFRVSLTPSVFSILIQTR